MSNQYRIGIILLMFQFLTFGEVLAQQQSVERFLIKTDRDRYFIGESVWFTIQSMNEQHEPTTISKIVTVELVSNQQKVIAKQRLVIDGHNANNRMVLPDTLTSGMYYFRVYAKWQQNFILPPPYIKPVQVINPYKKPFIFRNESIRVIPELFIEGGSLINQFENRVVLKCTDEWGRHVPVDSLFIASSDGQRIPFEKIAKGYYASTLIPERSTTYHIKVKRSDTIWLDSSADRVALHLEETEESIQLRLKGKSDDRLTLYLQNRHQLIDTLILSEKVLSFKKSELPKGLIAFDLHNHQGSVSKRLFYNQPGFQNSVRIDMERDTFLIDQQIEARVFLPEDIVLQDASISVRKRLYSWDSQLSTADHVHLLPYLSNQADLIQLDLEEPALDRTKINAYLITQSYLSNPKEKPMGFLPESKHQQLSGRAVNERNQPLVNQELRLFLAGDFAQIRRCSTDETGYFSFIIPAQYYGKRDLIIHAPDAEEAIKIIYDQKGFDRFYPFRFSYFPFEFDQVEVWNEEIINWQLNRLHAGNIEEARTREKEITELPDFYGEPYARVFVEEYILLKNMTEFFKEVGGGVRTEVKDDSARITIIKERFDGEKRNPPLILFNGYPVKNPAEILELPIKSLRYFDVIRNTYFIGNQEYGGLLNVVSLDPSINLETPVSSYRSVEEVTAPGYTFEPNRTIDPAIPDLETTLFWSPSVRLDAGSNTISFSTGAATGIFEVIISGTGQDGAQLEVSDQFMIISTPSN